MKSSTYYTSYDLGCCAALISRGFNLINVDRSEHRRSLFVFEACPEIEQAANDFWADRLEVNARTYFDNIKMLKSRIYSG